MQRKLCPKCNLRRVAINYYRKEKTYYRSLCTPCIHIFKTKLQSLPGWVRSGYKKTEKCTRCQFKFKLPSQSKVFYIDGNTTNNHWSNLRTICLNCEREIQNTKWRPSDINPDF
jgi:hypothetical protein